MKKILIIAAVGTMAMAGSAFASDTGAPFYDYGTVTNIGQDSIQLGNGDSYQVLDHRDLTGIKVGEKVDLWLANGMVTSIVPG